MPAATTIAFSPLTAAMSRFADDVAERQALAPAPPWPAEQATPAARARRLRRARAAGRTGFKLFSETYFPKEMFREGYSAPALMHLEIADLFWQPGLHWVAGSRKAGKTVSGKIELLRTFLTGKYWVGGVYGETLLQSRNSLEDIAYLLATNGRIVSDFGITILKSNADQLRFRVGVPGAKPFDCSITAFSQERSVRGYGRLFDRPEILFVDDLETRTTPIGGDHTQQRAAVLAEAKSSLGRTGVIVLFGNNFDERTLLHRMIEEQRLGILPAGYTVNVFPAWDATHGSCWPARYPATTEEQMRAMMEPAHEAEWQGEYQQNPQPPDGFVYVRDHYQELPEGHAIPDDARGVLYADQNLALRAMGDTTGGVEFLYSPRTEQYYVGWAVCRSYADPNRLLGDILAARSARVFVIGMDGWVSQESHWRNHIRSFCARASVPFPHVEFCRFSVDQCATNLQALWVAGRIWFPNGFAATREGKVALQQIFAFTSKKAKRKDDFPDALICANELLHASGYVRPTQHTTATPGWTHSITDRRLW